MALVLAMLSSLCFGVALVTGRVGLRTLDARSGAAISVPTATLLFAAAAPFALDTENFTVGGALVFVLVGLFFPALVTLLTFRSNEQLGPTVTSAVSGTAPLFALLAAGLLLDERVPVEASIAATAVVMGVGLLSWNQNAVRPGVIGWSMLWPIAGAVVRGLAQAGAKAGLLLWPSPFSAGLIGYSMSSATLLIASRFGRLLRPRPTKRSVFWFAVTGMLNGSAVLLMYAALNSAPVSAVAPIVASYPLITALVSAAVLREERFTLRMMAGSAVIVAAIVHLVSSRTGV